MKHCIGIIISLLGSLIFCGATNNSNATTKVSIYYESLCPGSVYFITENLFPNYEGLKDSISIDWVPYGHANQTKLNGHWNFQCQHGNRECKGNMYQACALDQNKGQESNAKFINCVMSQEVPSSSTGIEQCSKKFGFDWTILSTCFNSNKGHELLAALGDKTHALKKNLKYVPTIIYNDVYNEKLCDESLNNFLETCCSQIREPKPTVCSN